MSVAKETIEYQSSNLYAYSTPKQLERRSKNELSWEWNSYEAFAATDSWKKLGNCAYLSWKFSWDEEKLKKMGIYGFEGVMTLWNKKEATKEEIPFHFKIKLTHSGQCVKRRIGAVEDVLWKPEKQEKYFRFKFALDKVTVPNEVVVSPEYVHVASDTILVVEGQKISVNKNQLSMCSDYFNTLFNSDFKEKWMVEIPIEDVKYVDFRRLLSSIHPKNPAALTDDDIEVLLELADRFMMPAVTNQVENYLLNNSELPFKEILQLADKFGLEKLVEQCMMMLTTTEHMKNIKDSSVYLEISDSTKSKMLDRVMTVF